MTTFIILPNQLFEDLSPIQSLGKIDNIYVVEHSLYFEDGRRIQNMNKLKLLLHRASMKKYSDYLKSKKLATVEYIDFANYEREITNIYKNSKQIAYYDPVDHLLKADFDNLASKFNKKQTVLKTQGFICSLEDLGDFVNSQGSKKRVYFQTDFYRWQRERLNILMDGKGKYAGGKLTFDNENRQSPPREGFPINIKYHETKSTRYITEAQNYVEANWPNNYGNSEEYMHIAFDFDGARAKLQTFLENRLVDFGTYEDAIDRQNPFLYHSILSSAINVGIITPGEVVNTTLEYYQKHKTQITINNVEGFIRQIVGWREYYRMTYMFLYDEFVKGGELQMKNKLGVKWYDGTLGVKPVDHAIQTAFKYGYIHHIQRLMIVGNFMVLCEISPDEMYRWFSEFAIDAYDWVMVPNVYGMVAYNDGGKTTTKVYISSDNYVSKMSNYASGDWNLIWRALYYRFIHNHYELMRSNPRTIRMTWAYDRMNKDKLESLLDVADSFFK